MIVYEQTNRLIAPPIGLLVFTADFGPVSTVFRAALYCCRTFSCLMTSTGAYYAMMDIASCPARFAETSSSLISQTRKYGVFFSLGHVRFTL